MKSKVDAHQPRHGNAADSQSDSHLKKLVDSPDGYDKQSPALALDEPSNGNGLVTNGGFWSTNDYSQTNTTEEGMDRDGLLMRLRFKPRAPVVSGKIGLVQTAS